MGFGIRGRLSRAKTELGYRFHNFLLRPNKRLSAIYYQPSDMCEPDKIMLYAMVRGLRPKRVLEIGVRWGGGARIISTALEENGEGNAVGIDPATAAFRPKRSELFGRYRLLDGYSPAAIPDAIRLLGGNIDLCLIDAMHTHDHVFADLTGVLPHLSPGAYVLLHDTFHAGINAAIEDVMADDPSITDCGFLTRHPEIGEAPVGYQGIRLLRVGDVGSKALIAASFADHGKVADFSPEIHNWDSYWNMTKEMA
jgi:cephalosporin hydroxylase